MSVMYRLICADCAEEVLLGDIHPDRNLSKDVDVFVPDNLNSINRTLLGEQTIAELGFFLVKHVSHQLTVVNEFGLASVGLHGELGEIGSVEYLVHLAEIDFIKKREIFERASVLPEGFHATLKDAAKKV